MKLSGYDLKSFVLVVHGYPEKTAFIQNHFQEMGMEAENFYGINADAGLITSNTYDVDNPNEGYHIGPKPTATWVSYFMLLSALNTLPGTHFLTMEWDCKLHSNWRKRTEIALHDVPPDFDVLMLGSCCAANKSTNQHIAGEVWDVRYPMCNHMMVIAKKALPVILRTQNRVYAPWDISLCNHSYPHLKVFTVLPRLADQWHTTISP